MNEEEGQDVHTQTGTDNSQTHTLTTQEVADANT